VYVVPIETRASDSAGVVHTVLSGRVTDAEILAYYQGPIFQDHTGTWIELVDALGMTDMAITSQGLWKLAQMVGIRRDILAGGRVAMVAGSDAAFGMFRMWELQRESLPYEVKVFRDLEKAAAWLHTATPPASESSTSTG
jgi:hypothetical protein